MEITQNCKKGCPLDGGVICTRSMEAMSLHRGQLMLGQKHLSEHCPNCGGIVVWIIEGEPRYEDAPTGVQPCNT